VTNTLKITNELAAACAERQRAGLSLREIAAWLSATHGVQVVHAAVRLAIERHATREAAAGSPASAAVPRTRRGAKDGSTSAPRAAAPPTADHAPPAATGGPEPTHSGDGIDEGQPDLELLDKMIRELDVDIEAARRAGAVQALATLTRLQADLIERRRKIRPPPPVAVDDELLDAGRRAVEKLDKLVTAECEALGKAAAPRADRGGLSKAQALAARLADAADGDLLLAGAALRRLVASLSPKELAALWYEWRFWARPDQLAPVGDWDTWLLCTGIGFGKALALDTPIPTPSGWSTMGALRVADEVFDENGGVCRVTFATDVQYGRECFDVVFDDGTVIVADAEHRWLTQTWGARRNQARRIDRASGASVVTTREILGSLRCRHMANHAVDVAGALDLSDVALPVDPYVLGVWLGDGDSKSATLTSADEEMTTILRAAGCETGVPKLDPRSRAARYSMGSAPLRRSATSGRMVGNGSLHTKLRELGVLNNKHIPMAYLRGSIAQRSSLLEGLLDTDGYCSAGGHVEFCSVKEGLAHDVLELVRGLGFKPVMLIDRAKLRGIDCGPRYRITFTPHRPVFRLSRKASRQHAGKAQAARVRRRYIVDVRPRPSVPVRCITVDSRSHLYLASKAMIPTHNTRSGAEWIRDEVGKAASTGFVLRIALVGATAADVRDTMIEGESGILAVSPPESWGIKVDYESSKRRVTWYRAGVIVATATCFSAEEPDRLRGPNISHAWCDELAAWENLTATWLNLQGRMRLGPHPKVCVTTTPRPLELLRDLAVDPRTVVVRGSSMANAANLPDRYKRQLAKHAGTEYGRQEVEGEILDDRTGAMFSGKWFRRLATEPELRRVVVAIDPAISTEHYSDETGIMVVGADFEDRGYVLDDKSAKATPEGWAERAIQAFDDHGADAFVVERNRGGDLVRSMLRAVLRQMGKRESDYRVHEVSATRGKAVRADPIAAIYEHGNVFHVGPAERFAALEKELITWDPSTVARKKAKSPNRLDALVWGLTFLALGPAAPDWSGFAEANGVEKKVGRPAVGELSNHYDDAADDDDRGAFGGGGGGGTIG
jgi:phage terminase large subunit-like protein